MAAHLPVGRGHPARHLHRDHRGDVGGVGRHRARRRGGGDLRGARRLLDRAQRAGAIRPDIDPGDLLRLTNAIGVASERTPDREAYAARMLALLFDGLRTG
ncbi:SbtR family transcriptional regulator [Actinomadura madurae]|uniref:SbtR family transcriptional regulator n=1 Tax=Actinomadura madurae TaxID=1993 RepID=UPI0035582F43